MKELDPRILLAVFQEMLGVWLWPLVAVAVLGTLAFVLLLVRDRGLRARRLVGAQVLALPGGALALWIMASVSSSGFADAAGPADWILIALVFVLGAVGTTIVAYTLAGWLGGGARGRRA
ncbi:MAG: DUF5368 domain-containing protein [Acidovorax sp.]